MKLYLLNDYTHEVFTNEEEAIKQAEEYFYHSDTYLNCQNKGSEFYCDYELFVEEYRDGMITPLKKDYDYIKEHEEALYYGYSWSSSVECIYLNLQKLTNDIEATYRKEQFEEELLKEFEEKAEAKIEAIKPLNLPPYQSSKIKQEIGQLVLTLCGYKKVVRSEA